MISLISLIPDFPGKYKFLNILLQISPFKFHRSRYGPLLTGDKGDLTYSFSLAGAYGTFIRDEIQQSPKESVFIDIGANGGLYSLIAAEANMEAVYAIEPNPSTFCHLVTNIARNGHKNITALCTAIFSNDQNLLPLGVAHNHSGLSSLVEPYNSNVKVLTSNSKIFDALLQLHRGPFIIKIDVEGAERYVLNELFKSKIESAINTMIIEISERYHSTGEIREIYKALSNNGFSELRRSGATIHYDAVFQRLASK